MENVYIVAACRTPYGKMGGSLKSMTVADLSAVVFKEAIARAGITAEMVDEIVMGETRPSSAIHNVARYAALMAGFPYETTAYTIQQACSSAMAAIQCSANKIAVGMADIIIAGGVESMSNAPFFTNNIRYGINAGNFTVYDSITESQVGAQPTDIFGRFSMGETAETVAEQYGVTREAQDRFAQQSQERYQAAYEAGKFDEIVPITIPQRKGDPIIVDKDEHPRLATYEKLASLKPVFKKDGTVTVGNACGRNDGAAVVVLMSGEKVKELGIKPTAKLIGYSTAGVDPRVMGIGPVPAVRKVLKQLDMTIDQMDLVELNEAFAAQALACVNELGIDQAKLNVNGGAIALGHPSGSTGARLVATLCYEMQRRPEAKYALATMCVGGGFGSAIVIERV
ncbi:MAG: thiolase family protein [Oscillospiraceae bacterium]|nr:thiolase family protein [Oscillospiraceae bacterium]